MHWVLELPWTMLTKTTKTLFGELGYYMNSFINGFKFGFTYTPLMDFVIFNIYNPMKYYLPMGKKESSTKNDNVE